MPAELRVRTATVADTDTVMTLLAEATSWLAGRGTDQWQRTEHRLMGVRRDIDCATLFLVVDHDCPVGTITVDDVADADFWRRRDGVRSALYVHRMAVARSRSGEGIGSAMLDWAGRRALRKDRTNLRLDAWRSNEDLHKYYRKQGFRYVRTEPVPGRGSGVLFERPAGTQIADHGARIVTRWAVGIRPPRVRSADDPRERGHVA